jgi:hypothetical protein
MSLKPSGGAFRLPPPLTAGMSSDGRLKLGKGMGQRVSSPRRGYGAEGVERLTENSCGALMVGQIFRGRAQLDDQSGLAVAVLTHSGDLRLNPQSTSTVACLDQATSRQPRTQPARGQSGEMAITPTQFAKKTVQSVNSADATRRVLSSYREWIRAVSSSNDPLMTCLLDSCQVDSGC